MRWQGRRESGNVVDRRGRGGMIVGGGIGTLILALIVMFLGGDPSPLLQSGGGGGQLTQFEDADAAGAALQDEHGKFIATVLADTEDVWNALFAQNGAVYQEPKLVLFSGRVNSACGMASAAVGPFYCPSDQNVYIDLSFYDELQRRFGAPGDFAQAYVIAHEIGHHVQNQLGISGQVDSARRRVDEGEYNRLSVRLELQADYLAGVWAHHAQRTKAILEPGDVEEALTAASAIGDDNIQKQSQGYVVPDSFTHGSSDQRVKWFRKGFQSGDMNGGDTFELSDGEL